MTTKIEVVEFRSGKFGVRKTVKKLFCSPTFTFLDLDDYPGEQNWRPAESKHISCCQGTAEWAAKQFNRITTTPDVGTPVPMNAI